MTALRIDSSARYNESNSRVLTQYLIESLDCPVVTRDLSQQTFPALSADDLMDMHNSNISTRNSFVEHQSLAGELIDELKNADTLVFGVPIYNFGVPAVLKQWVDYVVKSGITFTYGSNGPEGLSGVKRAYIVTSSGGTDVGGEMDFASPYIEHICRFIGVENIHHIKASGSSGSTDQIINDAKRQIDELIALHSQ